MVRHLSQEWLDRYRELCESLPEVPGATGELHHTITKAPSGDVAYGLRFEDGRLVSAHLGAAGDDALLLTIAYPDAEAMARGELDLPVGFMRGRVKLVGDTGRFFALQPLLQGEPHREVLARLAEETDPAAAA